MQQLIAQYGLPAIFIVAAIEGDVVFIVGGVLAALEFFEAATVFSLAVAGVICGDTMWYVLGRWHGRWFRNTDFYRRIGPKIESLVNRFGPWELVAARIIYGTRIVSMIYWGIHRLRYRRFLTYNAAGILPWGALLIFLGYGLGGSAELLIHRVKRIELGLLVALLAGWALFLILEKLLQTLFRKKTKN